MDRSKTIVAHAQFTFGNDMIRLGSVDNPPVWQRLVHAHEINGREKLLPRKDYWGRPLQRKCFHRG